MRNTLSPAEADIMDFLENGALPEEIQSALKIRPTTYRVHCHNIRRKLGPDALFSNRGQQPNPITGKSPTASEWAVLQMRFYQRLTFDQIAEDMGITRQTAYNHACQGRKKLGLPRDAGRRQILEAMGYAPAKKPDPMNDPMF